MEEKPINCKFCPKTYKTETGFKNHMQNVHPDKTTDSVEATTDMLETMFIDDDNIENIKSEMGLIDDENEKIEEFYSSMLDTKKETPKKIEQPEPAQQVMGTNSVYSAFCGINSAIEFNTGYMRGLVTKINKKEKQYKSIINRSLKRRKIVVDNPDVEFMLLYSSQVAESYFENRDTVNEEKKNKKDEEIYFHESEAEDDPDFKNVPITKNYHGIPPGLLERSRVNSDMD